MRLDQSPICPGCTSLRVRGVAGPHRDRDLKELLLAIPIGVFGLGSDLGLPVEHTDNHAAYIGSWIKLSRKDSRAIFTAAARAEEAYGYLLRLTRLDKPEAVDDPDRMAA